MGKLPIGPKLHHRLWFGPGSGKTNPRPSKSSEISALFASVSDEWMNALEIGLLEGEAREQNREALTGSWLKTFSPSATLWLLSGELWAEVGAGCP